MPPPWAPTLRELLFGVGAAAAAASSPTARELAPLEGSPTKSLAERLLGGLFSLRWTIASVWYFEEVAEIIWAWYATLSGALDRRVPEFVIDAKGMLAPFEVTNAWYDGQFYHCEVTVVPIPPFPFEIHIYDDEKNFDYRFKFEREEDIRYMRLKIPKLPHMFWLKRIDYDEFCIAFGVPPPPPPTASPAARTRYITQYEIGIRKPPCPRGWRLTRIKVDEKLAQTTIPVEPFRVPREKYWANMLMEKNDVLRDLIGQLKDAYMEYARLGLEWIDDDEPTPDLLASAKFVYEKVKTLEKEVLAKFDECIELHDRHIPWVRWRKPVRPRATTYPPDEWGVRHDFNIRLRRIIDDVQSIFADVIACIEDIIDIVPEFKDTVKPTRTEYERRLATLLRQREDYKARGLMMRVAEVDLKIKELKDEFQSEVNKLKREFKRKHRDLFDKLQSLLRDWKNLWATYFRLTVIQSEQKLLEMIEGIKIVV